MRKAFGIFILSVLLLAAALGGCNKQGGSAADDFPTLTLVPPTATPAPPTATPVPPTATPIPPTKQTLRLDDPKTWDLKPYPEGKEPLPEPHFIIFNEDGSFPQIFYIANPKVRDFFINLAKESLFEQFGPGHGKSWVATDDGFDAFRKKWIIVGSQEEKNESKARQESLRKGVFAEHDPSPLDPNYAYFWEVWLLYDQNAKRYSIITRWGAKPRKIVYYHLRDDSPAGFRQVVQPAESFILWYLDKDGKWKRLFFRQHWLNQGSQPEPVVYDPAP